MLFYSIYVLPSSLIAIFAKTYSFFIFQSNSNLIQFNSNQWFFIVTSIQDIIFIV